MAVRGLMRAALGAAVPLHAAELARRPWAEVQEIARECGQIVASHGDDILYRSKRRGGTAAAFNALARGLAACSFAPGGVRFLGDHYQHDHPEIDPEAGRCR